MITIGYSTKKIDPLFKRYIQESSGIHKVEVIPYENKGEYSLTEAYNYILEKATYDIVVLCHDDIYFEKKNWGRKILKHFKRNPEYGILGVAGTKQLPSSGMWWEDKSQMCGIVNHQNEQGKWTSRYSPSKGNEIDDVEVLDGVFMIVNKNKIVRGFNEKIEGFHFYDIDFTYNNHLNGVSIGVIYDIRITHLSMGMTNQQWEDNRRLFVSLYKDKSLDKILQL